MNTAEDGRRTPTYDEKKSTPTTTVDDVNAHGTSEVVDAATEARLLAKLDRRLVPMISWIYLMNFMDRVNIGNGRLYGLEQDLGLQGSQYQIAVSVLFITYCLFETPSNLIIKRLQPARYLAGLMLAWGLVATFSAFVTDFASLVGCRLLLGTFEAGLFPGMLLYQTLFYNKRQISLRTAYFYATSAAAGAIGGLVAYGISFMDNDGAGTAGWRAWRWIILINGIPTVLTAFFVPFVLPNSIETASFLTEDERRLCRLMRDNEIGITASSKELHKEDVMAGVKDWKIYAWSIAQFCGHAVLYSFSVFLPTIISEMGQWNPAEIQALTVPVYAVGVVFYLTAAKISDRTQHRAIFCFAGGSLMIVGYCLLIAHQSVAMSFAGCFIVAAGLWMSTGTSMAWINVNNPRYGKRAYASGMLITIGNSSGVASPFLFSSNQAPTYRPGYGATIGMLVLALVLHIALYISLKRANNRKLSGKEDWRMEGKTEEEIAELGEDNPRYLYTI
ncbi:major facilitator superfamily domain-containing protein [Pterulicium gracile]|uniref:Major facilitator superfamily domain-containing protein n=1 Tax=Pterulicium gracile TaxID=1884261 RepID=A0A5C3QY22_9AGAR|nr:major facilitator superfamily domain-containing protein [Pterula gracilis]